MQHFLTLSFTCSKVATGVGSLHPNPPPHTHTHTRAVVLLITAWSPSCILIIYIRICLFKLCYTVFCVKFLLSVFCTLPVLLHCCKWVVSFFFICSSFFWKISVVVFPLWHQVSLLNSCDCFNPWSLSLTFSHFFLNIKAVVLIFDLYYFFLRIIYFVPIFVCQLSPCFFLHSGCRQCLFYSSRTLS